MKLIERKKGSKVTYGGVAMRVVASSDLNTLLLISPDGEYFYASIKDLEAEAAGQPGPLIVDDAIRAAKVGPYRDALGHLLTRERHTKAEVEQAGRKLGIRVSAVYEALKRFRETGSVDELPPRTRPGGRGKSRLDPKAEKIIQDVLEQTVLKRGGTKPRTFYRKARHKLQQAGFHVSQSTLADRLTNIPEHRWTKSRKGYNETRKTHDPLKDHYPVVHRPLEAIQIDHWKADIEIVSDDRLQVIGRVWITLAIDIYSRMIFGMHVGIDPPSTTTFGLAMINGMTRKDYIAEKYGFTWDNPIAGKPERIEADNAGEFRGNSAQASCEHFAIVLKWRPLGQPQYGGHIERLNGNLAQRFKDLPGATGSTSDEKKQLRPELTAAFTLEDITRHVWLMVDEYHNDPHTGIGMTPLERHNSYYFGPKGPKRHLPPLYVDSLNFRLHWFPLETRTIQRYGIRIDFLDYYSESLKWLVRNRKNYGSVEVRRHPFDVRVIYVKHPNRKAEDPASTEDAWMPVHVRQLNFPIASIFELQAARREVLQRKRKPTPENLAKIISEQYRSIDEATEKTKRARRAAARKAHHDRMRAEGPADPVQPPKPAASPTAKLDAADNQASLTDATNLTAILASITDDDVEATFE
ncbi:putative transposase [Sphingobium sp. B7D2B]|uniref:Mu transposase C-terminal domain-containing protein n=1 Tax=Sphingobium sp. B7D2B TaxID=2940583 RepID=UPI0022249B88|nr:Mu transposase C-terminal domain-containing protein [Sphingobium sp. B7D2B]MCW2364833.1 putative transposase [Sphingobium sp. B7D2B]